MEQEVVMSGKYVRADDVMELINTSNRGTCDYFIVDQIEELCKSEKVYDMDKVIEQLEEEEEESHADFEHYANEHGEHGLDGEYDDWFFMGMKCAIGIMKRSGVDGN